MTGPEHIAALILFVVVVASLGFLAWEVTQATDADDRGGWS